jgi:hypothetical protein
LAQALSTWSNSFRKGQKCTVEGTTHSRVLALLTNIRQEQERVTENIMPLSIYVISERRLD